MERERERELGERERREGERGGERERWREREKGREREGAVERGGEREVEREKEREMRMIDGILIETDHYIDTSEKERDILKNDEKMRAQRE